MYTQKHALSGKWMTEVLLIAYCVDSTGHIYTGLGDGRIIKIDKDMKSYSVVLRTGQNLKICGTGNLDISSTSRAVSIQSSITF